MSQGTDYSTYNLLYSGNIVEAIKENLITTGASNFRPKNIVDKIALLSLQKELLKNSYGFPRSYKNVSGYLYSSAPGIKFSTFNDYYLDNLIVVNTTNTSQLISNITQETKKLAKIRNMDPNKSKAFRRELESLTVDALMELIEEIIISKEKTPADDKILRIYEHYIFTFIVPGPLLEEQERRRLKIEPLAHKGKTRGKTPPKISWTNEYERFIDALLEENNVKSLDELPENIPKIKIHTLAILKSKGGNYANIPAYTTRFKVPLRLMEDIDDVLEWRDTTSDEYEVYKDIIGDIYKNWLDPEIEDVNGEPIPYGITIPMMKDAKKVDVFKFRIQLSPGRTSYKICETYEVSSLFNALIDMGYKGNKKDLGRDEAIELARENVKYKLPSHISENSEDAKTYFAKVGYIINELETIRDVSSDRPSLCELIKEFLEIRDRFFQLRQWD